MNAVPSRVREPYLHSLDLLRGAAALFVCIYHINFMLTPHHALLPGGYLCVDLFFLLSGFVIARTYDRQIAADMTLGAFCIQRLARLYPLFFMTTLLGFVAINARLYETAHGYGGGRVIATLLGNLLLVPNLLDPFGMRSMFPFNGAAWSIFFELCVNLVFVLCWRHLSARRLEAVVVIYGLLLLLVAAYANSLDIGNRTSDIVLAIPRVAFSFFLGVWISRSRLGHPIRSLGAGAAVLGMSLLAGILFAHRWVPAQSIGLADAGIVLFAFPALFFFFLRIDLVGLSSRVAAFLGNISYSVYLLQTPLIVAYSAIPRVLAHSEIARYAPWAGFVFMPAIMATSFFVWKYFEVPAKHIMRRAHPAPSAILGGTA